MPKENLQVSNEFIDKFHAVRSHIYLFEESKSAFISLLKDTVEKNDLEELKYIFYSLEEIGTHGSIDPSVQIANFQSWLEKTDTEEVKSGEIFKDMSAALIRPEHLPQFNLSLKYSEADPEEKHNRYILDQLLSANLLFMIRETYQSRKTVIDCVTALLDSDKSSVEIHPDHPKLILHLCANLLRLNQVDRELQPLWQAIFEEKPLESDNETFRKLENITLDYGWRGLMNMPTDEGDWSSIPFDIAPQALEQYVQKLDDADNELKEHFLLDLWEYHEEDNPTEFNRLIKLANFDNWPKWAQAGVERLHEIYNKAEN